MEKIEISAIEYLFITWLDKTNINIEWRNISKYHLVRGKNGNEIRQVKHQYCVTIYQNMIRI